MPIRNIKASLAYEGTRFLGWSEIEKHVSFVLQKVLQENTWVQGSSRTDRGVHARGQVVNFFTHQKNLDLDQLKWSFNRLLPKEITIQEMVEMPLSFHPTLDAYAKRYCYYFCNTPIQLPQHRLFSWHLPYQLNLDGMEEAVKHCVGTHDFEAFCNQRQFPIYSTHVRTIDSVELLEIGEGRFCIEVTGESFLYKMVRNLVGTVAYVGRGKLKSQEIVSILQGKDRTLAGITAPAHGLFLDKIFYPDENQKSCSMV